MKTKRALLLSLSVLFLLSVENAFGFSYDWQGPFIKYTNDYEVGKFVLIEDGFSIEIIKSNDIEPWDVQLISGNPIPVKEGRYNISFETESTNDFSLSSRLGPHDWKKTTCFIDKLYPISASTEWQKTEYSFNCKAIKGEQFLFFQFGSSPNGTLFKIKNIKIEPILP